jgi:hypothetical protein
MHCRKWLRLLGYFSVLFLIAFPAVAQEYAGNLAIFNQADLQNFGDHYTSISGYLNIQYVSDLSPLRNLTRANGLYITQSSMTNLHGLESLVDAGVAFDIGENNALTSLDGIGNLQSADVFEILGSPALQTISGLTALSDVRDIFIDNCPLLTSITGLPALQSVNTFHVSGCPSLTDVSGLADLHIVFSLMIWNCPAIANCCDLYTPVHTAESSTLINSACTVADILAYGPCNAVDICVALQFKDRSGSPVGDVQARLITPGEKEWKQNSGYVWQHVGNDPYNALFKGWVACDAEPYRFKFTAPEGWRFVDPDSLILEKDGCTDYYSTSGHLFVLERIDGSTEPSAPPVEAACPPENTAPFALAFLKGSPSWREEGWCNAVDGDFWGWDGTATVQPDASGYAWAIFRFADAQTCLVKQVGLHVINLEDDEQFDRWVTQFEVLVSTTGMDPADFTSVGIFTMEPWSPFLSWFNLAQPADAQYVMLKILQPAWTRGNFKQVVEFCINDATVPFPDDGPNDGPHSGQTGLTALPQETALIGNYPNPFNPVTSIAYRLAENGPVKLTICNMAGQTVATLVDETQQAGSYRIQWNGVTQPSGLYLCRLQAGSYMKTMRMVLVK